jgi:ribosomal protein L35
MERGRRGEADGGKIVERDAGLRHHLLESAHSKRHLKKQEITQNRNRNRNE